MVGQTLTDIRTDIEDLAVPDGDYQIICARTGERPVPSDSLAFPNREAAETAAKLTEQYRATLRRYDPRLPCYDPIVCERPAHTRIFSRPQLNTNIWSRLTTPKQNPSMLELTEYCHRTAAAVFETLTAKGYRDAESRVMETYLERAETVADRDRLCLMLLESMAIELEDTFSPSEQINLLRTAAERLPNPPVDPGHDSFSRAFSYLEGASLLESYTALPSSVDLDTDTGTHSRSFLAQGYAFSHVSERLPTLPIALALLQYDPDQSFAITSVSPREPDTWYVEIIHGAEIPPRGLSSASITGQ